MKMFISNEWSQCPLPVKGTIPEDASSGHLGVRYEPITPTDEQLILRASGIAGDLQLGQVLRSTRMVLVWRFKAL